MRGCSRAQSGGKFRAGHHRGGRQRSDDHAQPTRAAQRLDGSDGPRADRGVRSRRRRRRGSRNHRHGRRPRLLRRRRPGRRREDVRLPSAREPRGGDAARQRRSIHAASLPVHQARYRRDQRPGCGSRRHDDIAHGRPPGGRRRPHGLRIRAPRHHPGGMLELVFAARGRHQPRDGMGRHGPGLLGAGGTLAHRADSRGMASRGESADAVEGITAFLQKRPAQFPDRVSDGLPEIMPGWSEPGFE